MPVVNRIAWIARQLASGRKLHLTWAQAQSHGQLKIKVILHCNGEGSMSAFARTLMMEQLQRLRELVSSHTCVDRGHKYTSGISEVCFWVAGPKHVASPRFGDAGGSHTEYINVAAPEPVDVPHTRLAGSMNDPYYEQPTDPIVGSPLVTVSTNSISIPVDIAAASDAQCTWPNGAFIDPDTAPFIDPNGTLWRYIDGHRCYLADIGIWRTPLGRPQRSIHVGAFGEMRCTGRTAFLDTAPMTPPLTPRHAVLEATRRGKGKGMSRSDH